MRRTSRLALWMNGIPVGYWDKHNGEDRLTYLPEWIADPQGRPLSLSLPFTPGNQSYRGAQVRDYFDNLLPDSENIRRRHWLRQGELAGLSAAQVNDMIDALTASAPAAIAHVADALLVDFPASLADVIFNGIRQQCARLAAA
ncbi:HipA N-terminal domain-containing protein [Escherichia coli]|nr:HipA N-terminal domain-containing protein [Escherichia coli]EHY5881870.1 HipA N-terminal domain-containing protein [Escherichia coli]